MGWWKKLFYTYAQDWIYASLEPSQVTGQSIRKSVLKNENYVRIYLKSMRIVNVRRGLTKFYGTVHSFASFPHTSGNPSQFSKLIVPSELKNVDAERIDRIITINKPISGWTPYRGGDVELEIGLFSIKAVEMTAPFLNLLEQIGVLAALPYLNVAKPFIPLMKQGLDLLTDANDASILEIGLSRSYTSLDTGYYLVMRAPKGTVNVDQLHLDDADFKLLDSNGKSVEDYPYMVLQIEATTQRDDWYEIPELAEAYSTLQSDIRQGRYNDTEQSLTVFKRTVLTCSDLLFEDAQKLASKVEKEVNATMSLILTSKSELRELPELSKIPLYD
jgi:hypothetical protein